MGSRPNQREVTVADIRNARRHTWQSGTLAMRDNRCTSHYAVADYLPAPRTMHRITVVDDARAKQA